jgi:hypothetical protein
MSTTNDNYCRILQNPRNKVCHCMKHYDTNRSTKRQRQDTFLAYEQTPQERKAYTGALSATVGSIITFT